MEGDKWAEEAAQWNSAAVLRSNEDFATTPFGVVTSFYESRGCCYAAVDVHRASTLSVTNVGFPTGSQRFASLSVGGSNDALIGS